MSYTEADYHTAAMRADRDGLLAIPQPPANNGPLYLTLAVVLLCLAGVWSISRAELRFVHSNCNANMEGCR